MGRLRLKKPLLEETIRGALFGILSVSRSVGLWRDFRKGILGSARIRREISCKLPVASTCPIVAVTTRGPNRPMRSRYQPEFPSGSRGPD